MKTNLPSKGQVTPHELTAFGITLTTRHGLAWELIDLLLFAERLAMLGDAHLVTQAAYDSNSNYCTITLAGDYDQFSPEAARVHSAARATLTQFYWFDVADEGPEPRYGW